MRKRGSGLRGTSGVRRRAERGASAVEFALILPVLTTLILGMVQYGWYFFTAQSASSAAREASRRLVVGDCQGTNEAENYARNQASLSSLQLKFGTPSTVTDTGPLPAIGQTLRVQVTVNGKIIGFLPLPDGGNVTRTVDSRVEDIVAGASC